MRYFIRKKTPPKRGLIYEAILIRKLRNYFSLAAAQTCNQSQQADAQKTQAFRFWHSVEVDVTYRLVDRNQVADSSNPLRCIVERIERDVIERDR